MYVPMHNNVPYEEKYMHPAQRIKTKNMHEIRNGAR
jgi:hypothetical protein